MLLLGKRCVTVKRDLIYRIFSKMPTIETERLILRRMIPSDSSDMYSYARLEEVTRFLTWRPHPNESYTREYLTYISKHYDIGDFYDWALVDKCSGKMIGTCGFTRFNFQSNCGEIGYVLNPEFRGRGLALEAAKEILRFGFLTLGLNRIEAKYMPDNIASRRVMDKLGMHFEGTARGAMLVKGRYCDVSTCAILKSDYFGS